MGFGPCTVEIFIASPDCRVLSTPKAGHMVSVHGSAKLQTHLVVRTRGRCAAAHIRGSREPRVDPAGKAGRVQLDRGRRHTDALPWIFSLIVVVVVWLVLATHEKVMCWSRLLVFLCLWNACLGTVQAGLSVFTRRTGRCCGTFAVGNRETFLSA
jgi:hypothetical protein